MPVALKPLEGEDLECVRGMALATFLDGECYAFAVALHRALEWPLIGLMGLYEGQRTIRHALVLQRSLRLYMDVRGRFNMDDPELGKPFGLSPPYELVSVSEADLYAIKPSADGAIIQATWLAQAIYPALPWRKGPAVRYCAFLEELEELLKKHGISIRSRSATTWPTLVLDEEEPRLVCTPSTNSAGYFFTCR